MVIKSQKEKESYFNSIKVRLEPKQEVSSDCTHQISIP